MITRLIVTYNSPLQALGLRVIPFTYRKFWIRVKSTSEEQRHGDGDGNASPLVATQVW
jgi:hypothetical protein